MPSPKGYVRDYKQEAKTATRRGEDEDDATRHRARYKMTKAGKVKTNDGQDVDHITPIRKGGGNATSNLRVTSKSKNRSFKRK